jgi:chromosome condensin MukBEF complex kleisin-like MukF subunit
MANINIELTQAQLDALSYVANSPQEWAENAITVRADNAIDEIVRLYTDRALDEGVAIPATRDLIVADAFTRGWVQAASEVSIESTLPE